MYACKVGALGATPAFHIVIHRTHNGRVFCSRGANLKQIPTLVCLQTMPLLQRPRHEDRSVLIGHCWLYERSEFPPPPPPTNHAHKVATRLMRSVTFLVVVPGHMVCIPGKCSNLRMHLAVGYPHHGNSASHLKFRIDA